MIIKHQKRRGFTLIELMTTVSIISLVASMALSVGSNARLKARDARRLSDIKQIESGIKMFYDKNGRLPTAQAGRTGESCGPGVDFGFFGGPESGDVFLPELSDVSLGVMGTVPGDPISDVHCDVADANSYAGYGYLYILWPREFTLGIQSMETVAANPYPNSPGYIVKDTGNGSWDVSNTWAWITGASINDLGG